MRKRLSKFLLPAWLILVCSCSQTRMLEKGQYLYDGATIKIKADPNITKSQKSTLNTELASLVRPNPNSSVLGIRFKLLVYNAFGKKKKGVGAWIRRKIGEPPVLASYSISEKTRSVLQNRLENRGFFRDSVTMDTVYKGRKMKVKYTAQVYNRYRIRNVTYPPDTDTLGVNIGRMKRFSLLKPGKPYDLDVIKNERIRIDARLKQRGFYYFNPEDLLVRADTTVGNHLVDLALLIKKSTPSPAREKYHIGDIIVFANYDYSTDTTIFTEKLPKYKGYIIIDTAKKFTPSVIANSLVFRPGSLYNRKDHDLALNRLISLGTFKFVKVRFDEADTVHRILDAYYYLTPTHKKSIRLELSGLTKSNNANGGLLSVNWRNRNFFRGAELFTASIYGGLEKQFVGNGQNVAITKLGIDLNLYFPKIIAPFRFPVNGGYVPKTRLNLGYDYFARQDQYTLNSFSTAFGYIWKESANKEHTLDVIRVTLVSPSNVTPIFQRQLDTNIVLARSIERQFIIGPVYNYNYNTQLQQNRRRNNFYFNGNLDLSANILGLASGADVAKGKEKLIFGTPYSQYVRVEADFRHYLSFSENTILASRITGGVGYAYGNSQTMPFVKEFFAGGANDIRAFRSRTIGPGTYYAGNRTTSFVADQPGDVKMELNTELRFKLVSVFRMAFFADAGNIWTLRTDSSRAGSKISKNFLSQAAVGVGTGLRVDVSILLIRLDLGVPVREPYLEAGKRWVFDSKNLVYNFAIGYPF